MIEELEILMDRLVEIFGVQNKEECFMIIDFKFREIEEFSIFDEDFQCWDIKL